MSEPEHTIRATLFSLGAAFGVLANALMVEVAPNISTLRTGVDPTMQGAVLGGMMVLFFSIAVVLVGVEA